MKGPLACSISLEKYDRLTDSNDIDWEEAEGFMVQQRES